MTEANLDNAPTDSPAATSESSGLVKFSQGMLFNVVIPLSLLLGGVLVFLLFGSVEPEKRPAADTTRNGRLKALPPVRVTQLESLDSTGQQLQLEVDGTVVPFRESRVAAEVAGRVVFKADECEAGSYVKEGQLLMRIDPTDYELEVQRLTRLQEQEYQALSEVDQEMANARRLIDVAKKDVNLQQKEVDRLNAMPEGFASRAEIDQANRALLAATQQLVSVENQRDLLAKRRTRLEATEKLAATQLKAAEINLERTNVRAPIEGVIVNEDADLNTFVARGNMLVTIEDTSKVEVATNLRMDQLYWILDQEGTRLDPDSRGYDLPETPAIIEYEMSGRDGSVYRWRGRLMSFDGIGLDPVTRTVPVRVVVDDPTKYVDADGNPQEVPRATALVRGMFVRVKLQIKPQTRLVVIPARALQPGNRVLQFVPDESVLKPVSREVSSKAANSDPAASTTTENEAVDDGTDLFDAKKWEPGRVLVRQSITPVDSLKVPMRESGLVFSRFGTSNRMWVCESNDADLAGGSFVVVSPLGNIDETGEMPVRAERSGMSAGRSGMSDGKQQRTERSQESTAAAVFEGSGDAS